MNDDEQIQALANDIEAVLSRYRKEFDMPYAAVIGVLEIHKAMLLAEAIGDEE